MPDYGPGARIRPLALITQLDPQTSEIVECGLRYEVELPSGIVLRDQEHWWHEATDKQKMEALAVAHRCIKDIAACRELEHKPVASVKEGKHE